MTIRLLIADDHEVVRTGLTSLMQGTEIDVIAEAANGHDAVRLARERHPDVALIDIRMSGGDGLDALEQIKSDTPDLPVLILSTYDNPTYVARAVALKASGYVLKGAGREQLLSAIRQAAAGKAAWSRDDMRRVSGAMSTPRAEAGIDAPLTRRESEVLRQMAFGLSNKEIAQALQIGYETVKEHVQHILRKIGVTDRTQAAVWAVRKGLV
jgi:DNA-binding NarL/FixJ family response regulator